MSQQTKLSIPVVLDVPAPAFLPAAGGINILEMLRVPAITPGDQNRRFWRLFQNDFIPDATTVQADLVEATFDGYIFKETSQQAADENPSGWAQANIPEVIWDMTGAVTPNVVYGAYLLGPDARFLSAVRFPAPIIMDELGDTIILTATMQVRDVSQA